MKKIAFREVDVFYRDLGEGPCIVLLHGYLETSEIWEKFAEQLAHNFRILIPDLPGHGKSGIWGEVHTMEDLAGSIFAILEKEGIKKIFLVGHSMGGYVTMAFAELYPKVLSGYSLFHSTCFADSEEKKLNRDREISLVKCGKKRQIVNVNIPKGFANENVRIFPQEVERAKRVALGNPDQGIIAILNGMKVRRDRTERLQNDQLPLLLIGGMNDNYIAPEVFEKLIGLAPHARVVRLENSGHMGFVEEPERSAEAIISVVK
jgi:pimeloyl-ACP methyl ester carboxylesterase